MNVLKEIKETVEKRFEGLQYKSKYFQIENKLVRVANHLPNEIYTEEFNEGVEHVLLVLVNDEYNSLTDYSIQKFCEKAKYETEYLLITEDEPFDDYCEMVIEKFLKQ